MKKTIFLTTILSLFLTLESSQAQNNNTQEKVIVEETVAIVGNETIMLSDLYRVTEFIIKHRRESGVTSKLQPAEEALELLLQKKLYTACARLDSLDKTLPPVDAAVQEEIIRMTNNAGSLRNLEKKMGKSTLQLREDLKKMVEDDNLANFMEHKVKSKIQISRSEVAEFYKRFNADSLPPVPIQLSYAQIVKIPPATDERKVEVRQQLLGLRERILNGEKMNFLARLYSQEPGASSTGGEFSKEYREVVAPFADAVRLLSPGQISEIVETEYGFHIIELISKDDDKFHARHILLKPEFTAEEEIKATEELDSIANIIREGKMTFAEAAKRFSEDVETKMNGGVNFFLDEYFRSEDIRLASTMYFLDQIDPADSKTLQRLNIGDISAPYMNWDKKGNKVCKIITILKIIPEHPLNLEEDYMIIENYALQEKQEKSVDEWVNKMIEKVYVQISPEYLNYNLSNEGWKIQSEKNADK